MEEWHLPESVRALVRGLPYTENETGMSGSRVLLFPNRVLKIGPLSPLTGITGCPSPASPPTPSLTAWASGPIGKSCAIMFCWTSSFETNIIKV